MNAPSPRPLRSATRFTVTRGTVQLRGAYVAFAADGRPRSEPMRPTETDAYALTPPLGSAGLDRVAAIVRRAELCSGRLSAGQHGFLERIAVTVERHGERTTLRRWEARRLVRIARALGVGDAA